MEKQYVACIHKEIYELKESLYFAEVHWVGRFWVQLQQDMAAIQAKSAGIEAMLKEWADTTPKGEQT